MVTAPHHQRRRQHHQTVNHWRPHETPNVVPLFRYPGGLQAYGFLGVFLGPVVLATIMAFVNIYKTEYAQEQRRHFEPEMLSYSFLC
jgi:hypothetical protein